MSKRPHKVQIILKSKKCTQFLSPNQTQYRHNPFRYFGQILKTFPDVILTMWVPQKSK